MSGRLGHVSDHTMNTQEETKKCKRKTDNQNIQGLIMTCHLGHVWPDQTYHILNPVSLSFGL